MIIRRWLFASMAWGAGLVACGVVTTTPAEATHEADAAAATDASGSDANDSSEAAARVSLDDYSRSCTINADCVLTFAPGCPDSGCLCLDLPLSVVDHARYSDAWYAELVASGCNTLPAKQCVSQCAEDLIALCEASLCVARPRPAPLDLAPFDGPCTKNEDCALVQADPCTCNACGDAAVARSMLASFDAAFAALPACGARGECELRNDCVVTIAECRQGQCVRTEHSVP